MHKVCTLSCYDWNFIAIRKTQFLEIQAETSLSTEAPTDSLTASTSDYPPDSKSRQDQISARSTNSDLLSLPSEMYRAQSDQFTLHSPKMHQQQTINQIPHEIQVSSLWSVQLSFSNYTNKPYTEYRMIFMLVTHSGR